MFRFGGRRSGFGNRSGSIRRSGGFAGIVCGSAALEIGRRSGAQVGFFLLPFSQKFFPRCIIYLQSRRDKDGPPATRGFQWVGTPDFDAVRIIASQFVPTEYIPIVAKAQRWGSLIRGTAKGMPARL